MTCMHASLVFIVSKLRALPYKAMSGCEYKVWSYQHTATKYVAILVKQRHLPWPSSLNCRNPAYYT